MDQVPQERIIAALNVGGICFYEVRDQPEVLQVTTPGQQQRSSLERMQTLYIRRNAPMLITAHPLRSGKAHDGFMQLRADVELPRRTEQRVLPPQASGLVQVATSRATYDGLPKLQPGVRPFPSDQAGTDEDQISYPLRMIKREIQCDAATH